MMRYVPLTSVTTLPDSGKGLRTESPIRHRQYGPHQGVPKGPYDRIPDQRPHHPDGLGQTVWTQNIRRFAEAIPTIRSVRSSTLPAFSPQSCRTWLQCLVRLGDHLRCPGFQRGRTTCGVSESVEAIRSRHVHSL